MKKGWLIGCGILFALFAFIGIIALYVMGVYNTLVSLEQGVKSQWAQVESVYQRRVDLVPNLVNATKGYLKHEQKIFQMITDARKKYIEADTPEAKVVAANELQRGLTGLQIAVEDTPELKANTTVQQLMDELAGTENRIAVERRRYNEKVQEYNSTIKKFPTNFLANLFGYKDKPYFKAEEGAEEAPEVEL